jgi:hypothetical protein
MAFDLELLIAFIGALAALVSALFVFYKWAVDQENAKIDQLRRELKNEIRAEIYRELLELNVQWLSGSTTQRNLLRRLSDTTNDLEFEDRPEGESEEAVPRSS